MNINSDLCQMSKKEKMKICYNVYHTSDCYKEAVRLAGISPNTYYRWRKRIRSRGLPKTITTIGKWGYDKKPHNRTPDKIRKRIEEMRRDDNYGTDKIARILERDEQYVIHPDTIREILKEKGLNNTTRKYPSKSKASWDKVIAFFPGDLIEADPVQFGELWIINFQDVLVKWRVAEAVTELTVETVKEVAFRALGQFPFAVRNLQWDNGSESGKDFAQHLTKIGARLRHTAAGNPWQNGMVERLNRVTRDEEFGEQKFLKRDLSRLQEVLDVKVKKYNEYRPHWSLGLKTPLEMWKACLEDDYLKSFVKIATG